jgi:hypothetical protein
MNTFCYGIFFVALSGIFVVYILAFRKQVFQIMKREHIDCNKNVESISDFKKIFFVLKNNRNLSKYERHILWRHLIFTIILIFLYLMFVYIMFFTEW